MQRGFPASEEPAVSSGAESERLADVFLANRARLARFLRARCGGEEGVDDLLQELWLRIAAAPDAPVEAPLPYLFRTAHRLVLDGHRGASRRSSREAAWQEARFEQGGIEPPSAERRLIAGQTLQAARDALRALGPRAEQVFRRYRLDGETQAAIAASLGVSLSTVEKDLQKAYAALLGVQRRADAD